ncbi:MAG: hypothetical protein ACFB11_03200 [Paracoccaceae bacterium]
MTSKVPPDVFVERDTYRKRRWMDALRLLPFCGLGLWALPIIWSNGSADETPLVATSQAIAYVFVVWLFLIISGFALGRVLSLKTGGREV